jgi:hypothetical protein
MSGSVITGMSCGLIPIVSKESGFNEDEANILRNCDINYLGEVIVEFSTKTLDWIISEGNQAMNIANTKFSENTFTNSINVGLKDLLNKK